MDRAVLANLMSAAIKRALNDLAACPVGEMDRMVHRVEAQGGGSQRVSVPNYHTKEVFDRISKCWHSPEAAALVGYVWDHGALKRTITRDDDQVPTRDAWERFVWGDLVHVPLLYALEQQAIDALVEGLAPAPWSVDSAELDLAVEKLARRYSERREEVIALCPIVGINIPNDSTLELSPEITVRTWAGREKAVFMTRFDGEFRWNDFAVHAASAVVQLNATVPVGEHYGPQNSTWRLIFDKLDLLKWAVLAATGHDRPLVEGPCMILGASGELLGSVKREEKFSATTADLDGKTIGECRILVDRFRSVAGRVPEIETVLWHFGRACVAPLARDIVLDSVIGLEMMLVPGPGESGYRFALHGATLLHGSESGEALFKTFQGLYRQRSNAAHGASEGDYDRIAIGARRYLAAAMRAVITLAESGQLLITKNDIGKAVTSYVLRRATQ